MKVADAPNEAAAPSAPGPTTPKARARRLSMPGGRIVIMAAAGVLLAILVAFLLNRPVKPQSPAFEPASNPFAKGIFANGMIESAQSSGSNTNIFPEVTGPIVTIYVKAGEAVRAGQPLFAIDDSVQRATTEQARLLAQGASAQLAELKAQPRRETLAVAASQLDEAQANLATLVHQRDKLARSAAVDPRSVSRNSLDSAIDAAAAARKASDVAKRQYDLTKAGAWTYDIQNQAAQYASLNHAWEADKALLAKYVVKASWPSTRPRAATSPLWEPMTPTPR